MCIVKRQTLSTKLVKIHNDVKLVLGHIDKRNKEGANIYIHSYSYKNKSESESEELVF